jgi:hypothetical protein
VKNAGNRIVHACAKLNNGVAHREFHAIRQSS